MKDPAFLFYTGDFISGTMFFSNEQVGIYIRLLLAQHQHGHLTEKQVKIICNSNDVEVMEKFAKDSEGKYYNERLEIEINKRKSFSESRANNRKGKTKEAKKHMKNKSKTYVNHMENENRDINKDKKEKKIEIIFPFGENFKNLWNVWKEFKKKEFNFNYKSEISEQAAINELVKLGNGIESNCNEIINQSLSKGWKGFFKIDTQNGNSKTTERIGDRIRAKYNSQ